MRNLGLKIKMALGFGVTLALLATTGVFSYYATTHLAAAAQDVENDLKKKDLVASVDVAVQRQILAANYFTFTGEKIGIQRYEEAKEDATREISQTGNLITTEIGKALLGKVKQAADQVSAITDQQIGLRKAGRNYQATDLAFSPKTEAVIRGVGEALAALEAGEDQRVQK